MTPISVANFFSNNCKINLLLKDKKNDTPLVYVAKKLIDSQMNTVHNGRLCFEAGPSGANHGSLKKIRNLFFLAEQNETTQACLMSCPSSPIFCHISRAENGPHCEKR